MLPLYPGSRFVNVMGYPMKALQAIANAKAVISSSLHGIVLADAFGIPRMWDWFDGIQAQGFKMYDYGTVVGTFEPGEWKTPNVFGLKKELTACRTVSVS